VNRLETGITGQDGGRERLGAYLASTGEQRGWEEKLHPYTGADGRSTPASGQDGTAMWMKTAVAEIEKLPAADQAELGELMTRFDGQCRGSRALKRFDCARRRRWAGTRVGPGVAEWDAEARTYDKNLEELKGRIDAFDAAGATLSTYFAAESSDDEAARHELLDRMHGYTDRATPASGHEPSSQTSTAEGPVEGPVGNERRPEPGGDPQEQTPPPAAQKTPAYERSRASDMNGADPQHVQTRLDVAKSFIHPIRTYTTGRSKNRWRQQHRHPVAAPATQARQVKSLTYVDLRTSTEARRPRWRRARRNPLLSVPADKQSNTTERGDSDG